MKVQVVKVQKYRNINIYVLRFGWSVFAYFLSIKGELYMKHQIYKPGISWWRAVLGFNDFLTEKAYIHNVNVLLVAAQSVIDQKKA